MATFHVLLVEDNLADAELVIDTLEAHRSDVHVLRAADGVEALETLGSQGQLERPFRPQLILLDLNLPRMPGREVLAEIKNNEELRRIPVVILTSSDAERDLLDALGGGANCYIRKPIGLGPFREAVRSIADFWVETARLPAASSPTPGQHQN